MRKCKRLTGFLLSAIMLCSSIPAVSVSAETDPAEPVQTELPAQELPAEPAVTTAVTDTDETVCTTAVTTAAAGEMTENPPVTTSTEEAAVTATTVTTVTAPAEPELPAFSAAVRENYPGGKTALTISLNHNPGIDALALTVQLPATLTPDTLGASVQYTPGPAVMPLDPAVNVPDALLYDEYNEEKNAFSIVYAYDKENRPGDLIAEIPLNISPDAEIGSESAVLITVNCIETETGEIPAEQSFSAVFTAVEPLLRSLPKTLHFTEQGKPQTLVLDPLPPEGSCVWTSSDPDRISVSEDGAVTAWGTGEAVITVVCETRTYTCKVTAEIAREIIADTLEITEQGGKVTMQVQPAPVTPVVWSSSDDGIASVDENGTVTAVENGRARITAECDGIPVSAIVTINFPCELNYTEYAARATGEDVQLSLLHAAEPEQILWESSNSDVAGVDESGLVTFCGEGEAVITAAYAGRTYTCRVENHPYLRGDADGNDTIDALDALRIQKHYNLTVLLDEDGILTAQQTLAADADRNGTVDLNDATLILLYFNFANLDEPMPWDDLVAMLKNKSQAE